jgi:hypothetical protein
MGPQKNQAREEGEGATITGERVLSIPGNNCTNFFDSFDCHFLSPGASVGAWTQTPELEMAWRVATTVLRPLAML